MRRVSVLLAIAINILVLGCITTTLEPEIVRETVEVTREATQIVEVTRILEITVTPIPTATVTPMPTPTLLAPRVDFSGEWKTNIAMLRLSQSGAEVSGQLEGYGEDFQGEVTGIVRGEYLYLGISQVLPWEPVIFWIEDDGNTLLSNETGNHWCGVREGALPEGCGFSGRWCIMSEEGTFPANGYAELVQDGATVRGSVYMGDGELFGEIEGEVKWAKGHGMSGEMNGEIPLFWWMFNGENSFRGEDVEGVRSIGDDCGHNASGN